MKTYFFLALLLYLVSISVEAITPPPTAGQAPKPITYNVSWTLPTTRANGLPLASAERKQVNLYATWLSSVIVAPEAATSYSFVLAPGVCVTSSDGIQATEIDTAGLESAPTPLVNLPITGQVCGPQALPKSPTGVTVTPG